MKEYRFDPEIQLDFKSLIPLRVQLFKNIRKAVIRKRVPPGSGGCGGGESLATDAKDRIS